MQSPPTVETLGDELYVALREGRAVEPLTGRVPGLDLPKAYAISQHLLERRLADGERVIGKKVGVTSAAVQTMLGVDQPDFGWLTDAMHVRGGARVDAASMIAPRAEGEIAFVMGRRLQGPGVTVADVLAATRAVHACVEIVDSRIRDWKIAIEDTVADNASCGFFVLGETGVDPRRVDLTTCGMVAWKNGEIVATGAGAAALGSPARCVAWLANTLGAYGAAIEAGDVVLSGSLVPLQPVAPGDTYHIRIGGVGAVTAEFGGTP